ncbi:MAG TPA: hypothetical protein VK433_11030 [Stellaceae bacterium]|nr:hypothetical protein [Stellaceae bacterium]
MAEKGKEPPKGGTGSVPSAKELRKLGAEHEASKAAEANRQVEAEEEHKKKLIAELSARKVTPDRMQNAIRILRELAASGQNEVMVLRFPNDLCSDGGRAINNSEAHWPDTLKGFPRDVYETWAKEFRDKGYRMTAKIVDFPGGKPGDVGIYMSWD